MAKDKTCICKTCKAEVREKAVSPLLVDLKECPYCYTQNRFGKNPDTVKGPVTEGDTCPECGEGTITAERDILSKV